MDGSDLWKAAMPRSGWLGTLLGAEAEVGEAGTGQRSGKVSLNRVGSLEKLFEFKHDRISFLKGKKSRHDRRGSPVMRFRIAAPP